jgi:type II secretory pathway component PulF
MLALNLDYDDVIRIAATLLLLLVWIGGICGICFLIHFLLTLPMRRAERSRLFLDLVETALQRGQPVEEALISASRSRDPVLGERYHLLAAWLGTGRKLNESLAYVPRLLPPQVAAMLKVGQQIGDLQKVLPACRQLLRDAVPQTRGAINYLVILMFVITPGAALAFAFTAIQVLPMFSLIAGGMGIGRSGGIQFLLAHRFEVLAFQVVLLLLLWLAAFFHVAGARCVTWLPVLDSISYWIPWRRKRMQRDFSAMLAVLLDAGMPESEAVTLAAECTANCIFQHRARQVVERLKQGLKLTEAVQVIDDSGEFRWRLTNACHAHAGFLEALAGWHESLDAKAFQQEQAAAHGITAGLVLLNGLFVGLVVTTVFQFLVSIINAGVLW